MPSDLDYFLSLNFPRVAIYKCYYGGRVWEGANGDRISLPSALWNQCSRKRLKIVFWSTDSPLPCRIGGILTWFKWLECMSRHILGDYKDRELERAWQCNHFVSQHKTQWHAGRSNSRNKGMATHAMQLADCTCATLRSTISSNVRG